MRAGRGIDVLQPNAGTVVRWCCIRVDLGRHGLGHGLLHVLYITVRYGEHEFSYSYIVELATTPLAVPDRTLSATVYFIYIYGISSLSKSLSPTRQVPPTCWKRSPRRARPQAASRRVCPRALLQSCSITTAHHDPHDSYCSVRPWPGRFHEHRGRCSRVYHHRP